MTDASLTARVGCETGSASRRAGSRRLTERSALYLRFKLVQRIHARGELGFVDEHDRQTVANGVSQPADFRDQEISILVQPAPRQRTAQNFQQRGIDLIDAVHAD